MNIYHVRHGSILPLGKQGENMARKIQFDISRWIGTFGPGTVQLLHQRSGDDAPYPVAVEKDGTQAIWTVTSADTAAAGTGRAELQYYVGDALAKSETWMTKVLPALGDASETPPEAQQGWVDQVLAQVAMITGMTAQAVELPAGSAPTADYTDGVLTIGIPLGGDVSEAQIAQAVAEYLSNNPIAETDPTVPAWAKAETKPSYTAPEVGADPSGTAASQVSAHNAGKDTHSDIRLLIQGLTERLNALADSDDTTLDQLSEIVAYIKSNRTLIEAITTSKVSVADIIDNLTTNVTNKPLSAAQGVALKALIDAITIPDTLPNPNALTFTGAVTGSYDGSEPLTVEIPSGGSGGSAEPGYKDATTLFDVTLDDTTGGLKNYEYDVSGIEKTDVIIINVLFPESYSGQIEIRNQNDDTLTREFPNKSNGMAIVLKIMNGRYMHSCVSNANTAARLDTPLSLFYGQLNGASGFERPKAQDVITKIKFFLSSAFVSGTRIRAYRW